MTTSAMSPGRGRGFWFLGYRDMDQTVVASAPRHPMGLLVLAALASREHHLDLPANLLHVLLPGNFADHVDQAVIAFLDDRLGT